MPTLPPIYVTRHKGQWAVVEPAAEHASRVFPSKAEAMAWARDHKPGRPIKEQDRYRHWSD
jgi:hypothetical protein